MQSVRSLLVWMTVIFLGTLVLAPAQAAAAAGAGLSLSPDSALTGGAAFTLTVHGSGFTSGSTVQWDETALATRRISATTLTAEVPARLIAGAGTARVTVTGASGDSDAAAFSVNQAAMPIPDAAIAASPAQEAPALVAPTLDAPSAVQPVAAGTRTAVVLPVSISPSAGLSAAAVEVRQIPATATAQTVTTQPHTVVAPAAPAQAATSLTPSSAASSTAAPVIAPRSAGGATSGTVSAPIGIATSNPPSSTSNSNFVSAVWYGSAATLNLPPTISSITPNSVGNDAAGFKMVVNGANFVSGNLGTVVKWNGTALTTTYVSASQVTAAVPASLLTGYGTYNISVVTTGGSSAGVTFTVNPPVPVVTSISPNRITAGFGSFVLNIYGSKFPATATLNWGTTQIPAVALQSAIMQATIPASLVSSAGTVSLTLTTAGGTSAPVTLNINPPAPTITSLSQTSIPAGSGQFILTINGTGFLNSSFVSLGAPRLVTTFVSTTQLTAVVPASLLACAGQAGVTVYTPGGGGWSQAMYFTVTPAPPVITSLSPASVTAGLPGFSLIVNGAAFTLDSTINWGGTALETVYVSPTELVASVTDNLLQNSGNVGITVSNSLGASPASTLTVNPAAPIINSFAPYQATAGMASYSMTFTGNFFTAATTAKWGLTTLATTYVSPTELIATVPASLVSRPGTVKVSLSSTAGSSSAYTVSINPAIQITTATVPSATAGSNYSATIDVTGGSPGYNWTVTGLPESMTYGTTYGSRLTITGTPATAGPINIQVSATDMAGAIAGPVSYTINVAAGPASVNNATLNGSYVCLFQGLYDLDGTRWASVASFQADGQGNFTGGVFDTNSHDIGSGSGILSGTYSIGADNNGMASLSTRLTENIAGIQTTQWAIAVSGSAQPAQQFRLVEADDLGTLPSGQQATANCYQATPGAFAASTLAGASFAFGMEGEDNSGTLRETVGRFTASTANTANGVIDTAMGGSASAQTSAFTATYTTPDSASGRFTMTLSGAGTSAGYTAYIIDANRIFVLDNTDNDGEQAGTMRRQQQAAYSGASLSGPFVLYDRGAEFNGSGNIPSGYYANVMVGAGDGNGNLTVNQSYSNDTGTYTAGSSNSGPTALFFDAANPGRATFPTNSGTTYLYLYDANSGFAMSVSSNGSVDSGRMEAQTQSSFTNADLAGAYLYGELPLLTATANGSVGEFSLNTDGTANGSLSTAGEGSLSWDQAVGTTYAWDASAPGTGGFQIADGADGEASCAVISATRSVCTSQTDPAPSIEILEQ